MQTANGKTTVYASWNGATKLASWRVLAGRSRTHLTAIATVDRSGFETATFVPSGYPVFEVEALAADGRVLGASNPVRARTPPPNGG